MTHPDQRSARKMHDQHSVDEADLRRAQQPSAGPGQPQAWGAPSHGEESARAESPVDLRSRYEGAVRREREAWERVAGLPGEAGFSNEAWEQWRDAVEARDRATRLLINYTLTLERGQPHARPSSG